MIIALIVVVMLWYSFRMRYKSKQWLKVLSEREKIEIPYLSPVNNHSVSTNTISYSDIIDEANIVQTYQKLIKEYEKGLISPPEFQELLTALTDKINIRDILEV
ncbi:MAG TPA: hypothetical protein VGD22_15305 [Sphingobacteriaceae bacterium]